MFRQKEEQQWNKFFYFNLLSKLKTNLSATVLFCFLKPDSCKRQERPLETKSILNISSHHWEAFDRCKYNSGLWQIPFIYYSMLSVVVHSENLPFRSVDKTPVGDLSNFQPLSSTVSYTVQGGSNFQVWKKTRNRAIYMKAIK